MVRHRAIPADARKGKASPIMFPKAYNREIHQRSGPAPRTNNQIMGHTSRISTARTKSKVVDRLSEQQIQNRRLINIGHKADKFLSQDTRHKSNNMKIMDRYADVLQHFFQNGHKWSNDYENSKYFYEIISF